MVRIHCFLALLQYTPACVLWIVLLKPTLEMPPQAKRVHTFAFATAERMKRQAVHDLILKVIYDKFSYIY